MPDFTSSIVVDVPALGDSNDFSVFAPETHLEAVGFLKGTNVTRLIISHPGIRIFADKAYDPIPFPRLRHKFPFIFLASADTNPLLYREF